MTTTITLIILIAAILLYRYIMLILAGVAVAAFGLFCVAVPVAAVLWVVSKFIPLF